MATFAMDQYHQSKYHRGCVLADQTGLGKAWEIAGLLLKVSATLFSVE